MHDILAGKMSEVLPLLPKDGIAYRGDPQRHSAGSLQRASGNYVLFAPGSDPEALAVELQEGVNFAVQFSYPICWPENPKNYIMGEFNGYAAHYQDNEDDLPALSWGVSSFEGQLAIAKSRGRMLYTPCGLIAVGSVANDGEIAANAPRSPIVATLEDIRGVEEAIEVPSTKESRWRPGGGMMSVNEYIAGPGRFVFHTALGRVMALKFVSALAEEFGT